MDEDTVLALQDGTYYSVESDSDSDDSPALRAEQVSTTPVLSAQVIPSPSVDIHLLASKYAAPIKVIAYMDTGAHKTMVNPKVLPSDAWKPHKEYFRAADDQEFETQWISKKPVGIKFFPNCIIWTKVLGSSLPGKDILIGMDVYCQAKKLRILPNGISYRREFKPFTDKQKLYSLQVTASFLNLQTQFVKLCANSHDQFKHPHPLWKNSKFFIKLPFKMNEDDTLQRLLMRA